MSLKLKKFLFNEYGGFADKRVKDISKDYSFKIDDQSSSDVQDQFCGIFVLVLNSDQIELSLSNNAPISTNIKKLLKTQKGSFWTIGYRSHIKVELSVSDMKFIKQLSQEIAGLVSPGKKYKNPNWKWLCPRTSKSLNRLAKALSDFNKKS